MYSPRVTGQALELASAKLGFELRRHSLGEIEDWNHRLDQVVGPDGRFTRELSNEEKLWIKNERWLAKLDYRYWQENYCFILDWRGCIVHLRPNVAQLIKLDIWSLFEEQQRGILELSLKARQVGVTTLVESAVKHRFQFYPNVNAVVGSSDPDKSAKMAEIMELIEQKEPWWMVPRTTSYRKGELVEYGSMNSGVSIQHGSQFSGIARGTTPTVAHLSELADFVNPEELVDASLLRAMHDSPFIFLVLESTAKGKRNWWHRTWEHSKANWDSGKARLFPMFLPWFVATDLYPTETWLRNHPIPYDWVPSPLTQHHAERCARYVASNDLLRKYLHADWQLPRSQAWWWEATRSEYADKKELAVFYQETPADDLEAFQSTNISAFDADTLGQYRESCRDPIAVYGFVGRTDLFPERVQPARHEIDPNEPPLRVRASWGNEPIECQLAPLRFRGYPSFDPMGKLIVYEMPEEAESYGFGLDTSEGIGEDRSALEGVRKGTIERNDAQVCEFASPYVNAFDLWPICMVVGTLYATSPSGEIEQPKMVIECKGNGETVQHELRKRGWARFHQWIRYDHKRIRQSNATRLGWFTNTWSRAMMMDDLLKCVRDGWVDINSPYMVDELSDLERDESRQYLKAVYGGHDDRVMALAMVLFSLHVMEIRGGAPLVAAERAARSSTLSLDPVWRPPTEADFPSLSSLESEEEASEW